MNRILILCTGNSCRSQMAHAYFEQFASTAQIYSAGVETHGLNPRAVQAMQADGIDIRHYTSNHVDEYQHLDFDLVFTVCDHAREQCPVFSNTKRTLHFSFDDPAKARGTEAAIMQVFYSVRDQIKTFVRQLVEQQSI